MLKLSKKATKRAIELLRWIFGFEKSKAQGILSGNSIDEVELIKKLVALEENQKWLKKGFWFLIIVVTGTEIAL